MNLRLVANQVGLLMLLLSAILALLAGFAWLDTQFWGADEGASGLALVIAAGIGALLGGTTFLRTRGGRDELGRREAFLLVAATWIIGSTLAAVPYRLWAALDESASEDHPFHHWADCLFESVSGLTTTGATVLSAIGELPPSLLLWRATTHWLGGLGIVVLFVAVLPQVGGAASKQMFRVEAPGPRHEGVRPHIRQTSRVLLNLYVGLTLACLLGYAAAGMPWFDALCHAMSTISTGGLSTRDASLGHFDSALIDSIAILFMLAAGVNFALYYQVTQGAIRRVIRDVEFRVYLASKALLVLIIVIPLATRTILLTNGDTDGPGLLPALRHGTFTVVSMQTGTGFGTADFETWPVWMNILIVGLCFIGGCAGSTAGGIKIVRFWMAVRILGAEIEKAFRPQVVRPLRFGGAVVEPAMKLAVLAYVLGFIAVVAIGAGAVGILESGRGGCDTLTAATASLASLANVGPGLGAVGPTDNFGGFGPGSKVVLSLLMVLGRLEFFAILVLFTPRFWRPD